MLLRIDPIFSRESKRTKLLHARAMKYYDTINFGFEINRDLEQSLKYKMHFMNQRTALTKTFLLIICLKIV